jgi:hypothetical protein
LVYRVVSAKVGNPVRHNRVGVNVDQYRILFVWLSAKVTQFMNCARCMTERDGNGCAGSAACKTFGAFNSERHTICQVLRRLSLSERLQLLQDYIRTMRI